MDHPKLIDELTRDLDPVRRPWLPGLSAAVWLVAAWAAVTAMTLATGSMRPGFANQLMASPRFLFESLLGTCVSAVALYYAFRLAVPEPGRLWHRIAPGLALAALWVSVLGYGIHDPALEPSMVGKRVHCFVETLIYSVPPLLLAIVMLGRRAVLHRRWTAMLVGLAAAAVPALMMEFACMYDPAHILAMHISPVPVVAAVAAFLGSRLLPKI